MNEKTQTQSLGDRINQAQPGEAIEVTNEEMRTVDKVPDATKLPLGDLAKALNAALDLEDALWKASEKLPDSPHLESYALRYIRTRLRDHLWEIQSLRQDIETTMRESAQE